VKSLSYIDLGNATGGIVLNISEGGLAVHSAVALTPRELPSIRFQLPNSPDWVSAAGDIAWLDASRKEAGVRFATLPDNARTRIREWIASPADDSLAGSPTFSGMHLTSLKLGQIPSPREAKPAREARSPRDVSREIERPREIETIDGKLRLHFATRDLASSRSNQAASGLWWALILGVGVLAILSFGFGWAAGHEQSNELSAVLGRITGRTVAHAQNASHTAAVAAPAASANAAPQNALPKSAALPASSPPRVTFTTRDYVPVPDDGSTDAPGNGANDPKGTPGKTYELLMGKLAHRVDPVYPEEALSQQIEGTVQLHATVSAEGQVDSVSTISGDPTLASAAEDAVRQWRYAPTLLDGNPVPTERAVTVTFSLPKSN